MCGSLAVHALASDQSQGLGLGVARTTAAGTMR